MVTVPHNTVATRERPRSRPVAKASEIVIPLSITRLNLLGGFGLHVAEEPVALSPSPQRLLAFLALHETAVGRDYVAGMLWGDSTEAHAHGSLRSALWKLRAMGLGIIGQRGNSLELTPNVEVDARRTSALARALIAGSYSHESMDLLEPRLTCEILPGWYDDWILVERERHRQLSLHALEALCDHLTEAGRYGPAVLAGLAAVDQEPLRESTHRALVRAHLAEGNLGEAIRRYQHYERLAALELGVAPSPMFRALLGGMITS